MTRTESGPALKREEQDRREVLGMSLRSREAACDRPASNTTKERQYPACGMALLKKISERTTHDWRSRQRP
jgi:hypothetical protein